MLRPLFGMVAAFVAITITTWASAAPVPFPKPQRPAVMAGAWDVRWSSMDARIDLRPDGSARFAYVKAGGAWDGSWKHEPKEGRLELSLMIDGTPRLYVLTFDRAAANEAEGRVRQGPSFDQPVRMVRAGR